MPAGFKFQSKVVMTFCIVTAILLSACSRDNPLSIPPAYIEEPKAFCLENGPYSDFTLLESIGITNIIDSVPENYPDGYNNVSITLTAPFLVNSSEITPKVITDTTTDYNEETDSYDTFLIITEKTVILDLVDKLTYQEFRLIDGYSPTVMSLSVTVTYPKEGVQISDEINDENLFVSGELEYGKNSFTVDVAASMQVPRTFIDCVNPLTVEELESDEFKEEDRYRGINIRQSFPFDIVRKDLASFEKKELTSIIANTENDKFGKILSVNENFLIVGSPYEDSNAAGIVLADRFITTDESEKFVQNEDSVDSGAVYVFHKEGANTWGFHSFIKASNSEPGDLFGAAVSLYDSTLVISAPGEDSIASGIHDSEASQTDNFKLNNSAQSSGAVYIYELDALSNNWTEKYYIKPQENTISDGNYDKGFGSELVLYKTKLLISAPLEDSDDGDPSNSSQPDSGAVYLYSDIQSNGWSYVSVLKAYNPGAGDMFGSAIAVNDNYYAFGSPFEDHSNEDITNLQGLDEDTENPFENNDRKDSGAVYVFKHTIQSNIFIPIAHIKPTNSDAFDYFGSSVALMDNKLFVGSIGEDGSGKGLNRDMGKNDLEDSGAVYVFKSNMSNDQWTETAYIKANDSQEGAVFGKYLTSNSDSLFISAPLYDNASIINAGKVYFYSFADGTTQQDLLFEAVGDSREMRLGSQIITNGRNLAVGASGYIEGESGIDEAFVGKIFTYD